MSPDEDRRHRRLTELFSHAVELEEAACNGFLRALRGVDRELRADLEQLLASDQAAGDESGCEDRD